MLLWHEHHRPVQNVVSTFEEVQRDDFARALQPGQSTDRWLAGQAGLAWLLRLWLARLFSLQAVWPQAWMCARP